MELEIKVMWCKGLTSFNFFQKLTIYTLVSIKCEDERIELTQEQKQEQKTATDEENDGNPEWNHTLMFNLGPLESISPSYENMSLVFEFRHQGQLFGDKIVGEVCVPVKSLIDSNGVNVVRFVSYEVRSPEGKHNGVLDFSYKVLRKHGFLENNNSFVHSEICISGYHNHNHNHIHQNQGEIIRHQHQHYEFVEHSSSSESERIEYPRIDLEEWSAGSSALVTSTGISHYPSPVHGSVYPPPRGNQWGPPPTAVYPPPPRYGDLHWGYYRPPNNNNQSNGYPRW
ncbi:uncharacterized protein LOC141622230 [Silene latifolia]|uniref:uncharacterized protein LOC141622230 n=1 Tax=Silene latifolia TaxID=37657 RepID=UPI003D77AF5D